MIFAVFFKKRHWHEKFRPHNVRRRKSTGRSEADYIRLVILFSVLFAGCLRWHAYFVAAACHKKFRKKTIMWHCRLYLYYWNLANIQIADLQPLLNAGNERFIL